LLSTNEGFSTPFGSNGFCNSTAGQAFLNTIGGSGGPSGCATGAPATPGVVGGTCKGYPRPSWQTGVVGLPSNEVRNIPDGTSFSSPILAAIQALVNQVNGSPQGNPNVVYYQLAASEYGASGNAACNSTLGNAVASTCTFYDVTQGDMDVNCIGTHDCFLPSGTEGVLSTSDKSYLPAYGTTTGWDFATGIGTVNANNLVTNWKNAAPK